MVYTDGFKIGGGVGAGVAIYDYGVLVGEHAYHLPSHDTVFQTELVAIMKALELCNSTESYPPYSNSRSSLMALSNPNTDDQLCVSIHEERGTRR